MKAAIVGGGIGGLAAAVALRRVGIETVVYERARQFESVGAGLTLAPNAVRALERLGLADAVRAVSARGRELLVRTAGGHTLLRVELREPLELLGVHGAELQRVLAEAAGDVRTGSTPSCGRRCTGGSRRSMPGTTAGARSPKFDDERLRGRFDETWGQGDRFGLIPIGGGRVYWFVSESGGERARQPFRQRFASWH